MNTSTSKVIHTVSLSVALALCCFAGLQNARADDTANRGQLTARDYKFVTEAVEGGNMEVTLGQLASTKAADQSVRDFGQRMVQDHQKANQELTQLASQKGATVPEASAKKEDKLEEHLQGLSEAEFDKAYIKHMVGDHKKVIKEFQKAADKSDDADLKNWAAKTLPTLQEHLRLAENVEATISSAKNSPTP